MKTLLDKPVAFYLDQWYTTLMPKGVYPHKKKNHPILCHPEIKRHVEGICINCYSRVLKDRNPQYKINQQENTRQRYKKLGSKIMNAGRIDIERNWRVQALIKLGAECVRCGYDDIRSLHIDHKNSDGKKERSIRRTINRKIILGLVDISRYQLLCANCNWIKRLEKNEGTNRSDYNQFLLKANEEIKKRKLT